MCILHIILICTRLPTNPLAESGVGAEPHLHSDPLFGNPPQFVKSLEDVRYKEGENIFLDATVATESHLGIRWYTFSHFHFSHSKLFIRR